MDIALYAELAIFALLMGLSGFFSSSETALFSLNRIQLEQMARDELPRLSTIQRLLAEPRRLIVTILIGNELVNVAASNISATLVIQFMGGAEIWWINIVIMLPILLLIGEITPKTLAVRHSVGFSCAVSGPLTLFAKLILPLRWAVRIVADAIITALIGKDKGKGNIITEDMVRTLATEAANQGVLDSTERVFINNIFDFGNHTVEEVVTPRANIFYIPVEATIDEIMVELTKTKHKKIPVFRGTRDNVEGILHVRDLLGLDFTRFKEPESIIEILRKPLLVPESKPVIEMFRDFQERKRSIALTVDEYGGVTGMVTMDDLVGGIFRESQTTNPLEPAEDVALDEGGVIVPGGMPLFHFNRKMKTALSGGGAETVAGMLLHHHGELPREGDKIRLSGFHFTVTKVEGRRLAEVLVSKSGPDTPAAPAVQEGET